MLFNSIQYVVFLIIVVTLYWNLSGRWKPRLLLVASYLFYAVWDWRFLSLILASTAVDYAVGRYLSRETGSPKRKRAVLVSIGVNLGLLGIFKYLGFFVDSATELLVAIGLQANPSSLEILLPVGISFYTFQTLSYTIDVYRGKTKAVENVVDFATFVAFFPQLVAGPIERASHLVPQLKATTRKLRMDDVINGIGLILVGLFKKVAIADVAATAANGVFGAPEGLGATTLVLGVYAFAIQIYGDFSGYTDIARGSARLFGIGLSRNFRQPYLSRSITEFWKRWHISLSSWLRDYLYIPLGGNRKGKAKTYRNLMLTMLLGGLWHGAAWTFVVWGGLHGLALAWERWRGKVRAADAPFRTGDVLRMLVVFNFVCVGWIFFRADSFASAWTILLRIVTFAPGDERTIVAFIPLLMLVVLVIDVVGRSGWTLQTFARWPLPRQAAVLAVTTIGILMASGGEPAAFIYFQF